MVEFYKYHGAGNDFIIIDNRKKVFDCENKEKIRQLCDRHFGIGADGILLVEECDNCDFKMIYLNSDGSIGSMCGNGGRCIVDFVNRFLKIIKNPDNIRFMAVDGEHHAQIVRDEVVRLKMQDIENVGERNGLPFLKSGTTPHNIMFVENLQNFPVYETGKKLRYSDPDGVNIDFIEIKNDVINMRTYERGVEDETLACGTGAVCTAVACFHLGKINTSPCKVKMPGGELTIEFEKDKNGTYKNIWLEGPAICVFRGEIE